MLRPADQLRTSPLWPWLSRETTDGTTAAGPETENRVIQRAQTKHNEHTCTYIQSHNLFFLIYGCVKISTVDTRYSTLHTGI